MFRKLRGPARRQRAWTTAIDLETWADSWDARSRLPQLVRRLIHATVESISSIDFPAGEQVQRPGWDGLLETESGNAFVPGGRSGWEMGVDRDPRSKAEKDFQKRVKSPQGLDPRQVSFVFVTPRRWPQKGKWAESKQKQEIWKTVKVYDSSNLEEWLETAPAVDAWLARLLGRKPAGVTDVDCYWANLSSITEPGFKPEVFLASRDNEKEALKDWLLGKPPAALALESRSPVEAMDFVAACLASLDEHQRESIEARTLIIKERDSWEVLSGWGEQLVLVSHPALPVEPEMAAEAVRQGHHVLLCSSRFPNQPATRLRLRSPHRCDLEKALVSSGFEQERASRLARESGGSLAVLKRRATPFPSTSRPLWSEPPEASTLVPILLVGSWDDNNASDRAILEKLSGGPYSQVLSVANRWLNTEDPPITRGLSQWSLISREDSWFLLASSLTREQLETFEQIAIEVL
ncbi:MAG: hypothetical protein ACE5JX_06780, partial [Acidobacteriota bacterium]